MIRVIKYKTAYEKELIKLYCQSHNQDINYGYSIYEYIPDLDLLKVKLLMVDDRAKGYIFCSLKYARQDKHIIDVEEIFIKKGYDTYCNYTALLESLNSSFLFSQYKYARLYLENSRGTELEALLDLKTDKKVFELRLDLNKNANINSTTLIHPNIRFVPFKRGIDEVKRVKIQNSIFCGTKGHIDCNISDVIHEENQNYYLEDGAIFLTVDGNIAGYSQAILEKHPVAKPYIVNFGIHENYRSRGLAKLLLNHTLFFLKQKGWNEVYITVDADNYKAYNLYKKSGFNKIVTYTCFLYKFKN